MENNLTYFCAAFANKNILRGIDDSLTKLLTGRPTFDDNKTRSRDHNNSNNNRVVVVILICNNNGGDDGRSGRLRTRSNISISSRSSC